MTRADSKNNRATYVTTNLKALEGADAGTTYQKILQNLGCTSKEYIKIYGELHIIMLNEKEIKNLIALLADYKKDDVADYYVKIVNEAKLPMLIKIYNSLACLIDECPTDLVTIVERKSGEIEQSLLNKARRAKVPDEEQQKLCDAYNASRVGKESEKPSVELLNKVARGKQKAVTTLPAELSGAAAFKALYDEIDHGMKGAEDKQRCSIVFKDGEVLTASSATAVNTNTGMFMKKLPKMESCEDHKAIALGKLGVYTSWRKGDSGQQVQQNGNTWHTEPKLLEKVLQLAAKKLKIDPMTAAEKTFADVNTEVHRMLPMYINSKKPFCPDCMLTLRSFAEKTKTKLQLVKRADESEYNEAVFIRKADKKQMNMV